MTDFADLDTFDDDLGQIIDGPKKKVIELPETNDLINCHKCRGTGVWVSYSGFTRKPCFACKGQGKISQQRANRIRGAAKAKKTRADNLAQYHADHAKLIAFMFENRDWNGFFSDMCDRLSESPLTPNQEAAAYKSMTKTIESREAKRAARDAAAPKVGADLKVIHSLFDTALENGKKRRALLGAHFAADGLTVENTIKITPARAPRTTLWVKVDGEFVGGIEKDGSTRFNRAAPEWLVADLERIAADPINEAKLFGRVTGVCCCCAAELTHPESIKNGIGPICAEKWFG